MNLGAIMGDTRSISYHAIGLPQEKASLTRTIPSLRADYEAWNILLRFRQLLYNIMLIILELVVTERRL